MSVPIVAMKHCARPRFTRLVMGRKHYSLITFKHRDLTSPCVPLGTRRRELRSVVPYVTYLRNYITGVCTKGPMYYLMGPFLKRRTRNVTPTRGTGGMVMVNNNITNLYTTFVTRRGNRRMALCRTDSGLNKGVHLTTCPPKGNSVAGVVHDCVMHYRGTNMAVGVGRRMALSLVERRGPSDMVITSNSEALVLPVRNVSGPTVVRNSSLLSNGETTKGGILIMNNKVIKYRATTFLNRRGRSMAIVRFESAMNTSIVRRREICLVGSFRSCGVGRVANTGMYGFCRSNMRCRATSKRERRSEKCSSIVLSVKFEGCGPFNRRVGTVMPSACIVNSTAHTEETLSTAGRTCRMTSAL